MQSKVGDRAALSAVEILGIVTGKVFTNFFESGRHKFIKRECGGGGGSSSIRVSR